MMWRVWRREWVYLWREPWDFCLLMLAPLLVIVMFGSMFYAGKAEHLPIAFVDQDQSQLSRSIYKHLSLNHTLDIALQTDSMLEAEQAINQTQVWGYVLIPKGAEAKLTALQDPSIGIAYNQSYFSIGNSISSAMQRSTIEAMADFVRNGHLRQNIPALQGPMPGIKLSALHNPDMSYELFLEPFVVPAVLHLLLCGFCHRPRTKKRHDTNMVTGRFLVTSLVWENLGIRHRVLVVDNSVDGVVGGHTRLVCLG